MLVLLLGVLGCGSDCEDERGEYAHGESWTCTDGCNTCSCAYGLISQTEMACVATCTDTDGSVYSEGDTWVCTDGCNDCYCEPDGSIVRTEIACDG